MLFDTIVVKYRNCMIDIVLISQSTVKCPAVEVNMSWPNISA